MICLLYKGHMHKLYKSMRIVHILFNMSKCIVHTCVCVYIYIHIHMRVYI